MNREKLLIKILGGSRNVRFDAMVSLVEGFGFALDRVSGSHHIFVHPGIPVNINLQNVRGKAKPYQIRQVLKVIEEYNLALGGNS